MASMASTTRRTVLELRDEQQADHWVGIPATGSILDSIHDPMRPHPPTRSIADTQNVSTTDPTTPALNIHPGTGTPSTFQLIG